MDYMAYDYLQDLNDEYGLSSKSYRKLKSESTMFNYKVKKRRTRKKRSSGATKMYFPILITNTLLKLNLVSFRLHKFRNQNHLL